MRKRKKSNNWVIVLILICLFGISIGYSELSSSLSMTGQVTVNVATTAEPTPDPTPDTTPDPTSNPLEIGDTVNYITTMNGVTLDNWKVFYVDGDYTVLIYGDYLPNAAIDTTNSAFEHLIISTFAPTFGIYVDMDTGNRIQLLDAMQTKSNWATLLQGTINGTPVNYSDTVDTNIWAMGSPTIDLYVNSWNTKYPQDRIYTAQTTDQMYDGVYGYYLGLTENPTSTSIPSETMKTKAGYNNTLYYPYQINTNNCYGYWLASPSANSNLHMMNVDYRGQVSYDYFGSYGVAFRPVISLPNSILHSILQ